MEFRTPYPDPAHPDPLYSERGAPYLPRPDDPRPFSQPDLFPALLPPPLSDSYAAPALNGPEAGEAAGAVDHFLAGKTHQAARAARDLLGLIYERHRLLYDHHKRIEYESCRIGSHLLEIEAWRTGVNPMIDKTRSQLERERIAFEREKRMEEIACWRDTVRLKTDLREALNTLDSENRKRQLLGGPDGRP